MIRTEKVFYLDEDAYLRVACSTPVLYSCECAGCCEIVLSGNKIKDLIVALEQFLETKTFVEPQKYKVVEKNGQFWVTVKPGTWTLNKGFDEEANALEVAELMEEQELDN